MAECPNASLHPVRHKLGRIEEAEGFLRFLVVSPLVFDVQLVRQDLQVAASGLDATTR